MSQIAGPNIRANVLAFSQENPRVPSCHGQINGNFRSLAAALACYRACEKMNAVSLRRREALPPVVALLPPKGNNVGMRGRAARHEPVGRPTPLPLWGRGRDPPPRGVTELFHLLYRTAASRV